MKQWTLGERFPMIKRPDNLSPYEGPFEQRPKANLGPGGTSTENDKKSDYLKTEKVSDQNETDVGNKGLNNPKSMIEERDMKIVSDGDWLWFGIKQQQPKTVKP